MHTAVLWTISDFSAYGYLSGWITQGYNIYPVCLDMTDLQKLRGKIGYMSHRRYLPQEYL